MPVSTARGIPPAIARPVTVRVPRIPFAIPPPGCPPGRGGTGRNARIYSFSPPPRRRGQKRKRGGGCSRLPVRAPPPGSREGGGKIGQQGPFQFLRSLPEQVEEDEEKGEDHEERAQKEERFHDSVGGLAAEGDRRHLPALPGTMRVRIHFAARLTTIVRRKRTRPISTRADRYRSPVASVNSFAITAAIE